MRDKQLTIFYSWQSWTNPKGSNSNRYFIEDALERAANQVTAENEVPVIVTRDTKDEPGHPAIVDTIMKKIDSSDIYVADVSFVMNHENHYTPNPNVLIELGYALKELNGSRLILVMNTAYGHPSDHPLPFDFQHRRFPITYELLPNADSNTKKEVRNALVQELQRAIQLVIDSHSIITNSESLVEQLERNINEKNKIVQNKLFENEIRLVFEKIHDPISHRHQANLAGTFDEENPQKMINYFIEMCEDILKASASAVRYGDEDLLTYFQQALRLWSQDDKRNKLNVRLWPCLLLTYTVGTMAFLHNKWKALPQILLGAKLNYPQRADISDSVAGMSAELITETYRLGGHPSFNLGECLKPLLKDILADHFINDEEYEYAFVSFEMLFMLQTVHSRRQARLSNVKVIQRSENKIICTILKDWGNVIQEDQNPMFLIDGILQNSRHELRKLIADFTEHTDNLRKFYGIVNYLECFDNTNDDSPATLQPW